MIVDTIRGLGPWVWIVLGLILLGLEVLLPANYLIWFGLAGVVTGIVAIVTEVDWQISLLIFAVSSLVLVILGRRYFASSSASEEPLLNRRTEQLKGSEYVLSEPIVDGVGRIRINDSNWRISGPDLPSGRRVRVVGTNGSMLLVEPAD